MLPSSVTCGGKVGEEYCSASCEISCENFWFTAPDGINHSEYFKFVISNSSPLSLLLYLIAQHDHITNGDTILQHWRLDIIEVVALDLEHTETALLIEGKVRQ